MYHKENKKDHKNNNINDKPKSNCKETRENIYMRERGKKIDR